MTGLILTHCGKCSWEGPTENFPGHFCFPGVTSTDKPWNPYSGEPECKEPAPKTLKSATTEEIREELKTRGWKVELT
jgi:hypothetical protein